MQNLWTANYLCLSSLHMTTSGKQKLVKHHSAVVLEWRRPRAQKEVRPHTLPQLVALYGAQTPQSAAATYPTEKAWTGILKSIDVTNSPLVKLGIHLIQFSSICASCLQWPIYLYVLIIKHKSRGIFSYDIHKFREKMDCQQRKGCTTLARVWESALIPPLCTKW